MRVNNHQRRHRQWASATTILGLSSVLLLLLGLCHGQERPSISLNKMDPGPLYRTNVCDRQGELFVSEELLMRDALQNMTLSVGIGRYPPEMKMFSLDEDGRIPVEEPGLLVEVLDEVARRAGFTWRNSFGVIDPLTQEDGNLTWSDILEWEVKHYDIAADNWYRTNDRMAQGISFPRGWFDGGVVLSRDDTSLLQKKTIDVWSYLWPFDYNVWLMVVFSTLLTGISYYCLEHVLVHPDPDAVEESHFGLPDVPTKTRRHQWIYAVFLSSLVVTGPYRFRPSSGPSRILCLSWSFWSLIMTSGYTANLASSLVSRRRVTTVVGIDDAIATGTPLCVHRGTPVDFTLSEDYPQLLLVKKDTEEEMFESLKLPWDNGGTGCDGVLSGLRNLEQFQVQSDYNPSCTLVSDKSQILPFTAGFATAVDTYIYCTSLVSYVIDLHIGEMEADGFIDRVWTRHLQQLSTNNCVFNADGTRTTQIVDSASDINDDSKYSLSFQDMGGIFLTHACVSFLALLMAFQEYYYRKSQKTDDNPSEQPNRRRSAGAPSYD